MSTCTTCGQTLREGAKECPNCGAVVEHPLEQSGKFCPNCGTEVLVGARFCVKCGVSISDISSLVSEVAVPLNPDNIVDSKSLRNWWHDIWRNQGRYQCYAFFLCLPSDKEAIKYLSVFGKELDLLSGNNCLVIALSKTKFQRSGHFDSKIWNTAINEQVSEGYSVTIAKLFKIKFTEFPCIVLFDDIRSTKRIVFTFQGVSSTEIAQQMRVIFTLIQQAIDGKSKPLAMLQKHQKSLGLRKASETVFDKVAIFTVKTFETAMDTWIKNAIK